MFQAYECIRVETMSIMFDESKCTGCACCLLSCPEDAIDINDSFLAEIRQESCTGCMICLDYCPNSALVEG